MIDSSVDQDFAALERQESFRGTGTVAADRADVAVGRVYHGKLASLSPHREQTGTLLSTTATPDYDSSRPDPLGHLQAARLGFAAAAVLVIYWLWIRRRGA